MGNQNPPTPTAHPAGGLHLAWVLADDPRTITTKDGEQRTVIELRDPARLAHSMTIWLDGPAGNLAKAQPGVTLQLHVQAVRPGRGRGELVASIDRASVEAAFARSAGATR